MGLQKFPGTMAAIFIEEIEILPFLLLIFCLMKFASFNHTFGTIITHAVLQKAENGKDPWYQYSMGRAIYKVNLNISTIERESINRR
jgi:hypothetical protein